MSTVKEQAELIKAQKERIDTLEAMIQNIRAEMREGKTKVDRDTISEAMSLLYDPYDKKSTLRILGDIPPDDEYPEGQVLRWISPRFRHSGLKGWIPLQWGDKYTGENGEKLKGLISDIPMSIDGQKIDSNVRQRDVMLARLDKRIWQSRVARPVLEDARRRGGLESNQSVKLREGVYLTGEGIKKEESPRRRQSPQAPDMAFDPESGEGTHRTHLMEKDG